MGFRLRCLQTLITLEREFTVEVVGMEIWKLGLLEVAPAPFDPVEAPFVADCDCRSPWDSAIVVCVVARNQNAVGPGLCCLL